MINPLLALLVFLVISPVCIGFGRKMLNLLKIKTSSPVEKSVFGLALGFGVLAYGVLAVGLLGILYLYAVLVMLAVMILVSLGEIKSIFSEVASGLRCGPARLNAADAGIALSLVILGTLALISALSPPTSTDWDGLSYHLAVPKLYVLHHGIYYIPFTSHSNFPFLTEMLYTVGLLFKSTALAKLFHWFIYIATAVGLYSLGRRHFNALTGKVAALIFMSVPVVLYEAGVAYADLTMAFYVLMAVYALLNWTQADDTPWLIASGLMCGLALGTKVLAAVPIFVICLLILFHARKSGGWGRGFKLGSLVGVLALLVGCVWYIKTYIYTGNPFYPFLYKTFGGRNWSDAAALAYQKEQASFGKGKELRDLLILPWNLLAYGGDFSNKGQAFFFVQIGPAFISLLPIYVFIGKLNKAIVYILLVALAYIAAWFFLMQHSRYLITVLPLLSVICAAAVDYAGREWRFGRYVINAFLVVTVVSALIPGFVQASMYGRVAVGLEPTGNYLSRTLDVYDPMMYINEETPKDSRVVLFDETRGFYLDRDYIWGNPGHHEMIPWNSFNDGDEMVKWFMDHGFTHALVNWKFAGKDDALHGKLIAGAIGKGLMQEVNASQGVSVYKFEKSGASE